MKRATKLLIGVAIVLPALAAAAVQVTLWTDLPRRLVLAQLSAETGLIIDASSLTTGWRGRTVVHDLTATLPLEQQPFLAVKSLEVRHSGLIPLVILGIEIDSVTIDGVEVVAGRDERGQWNLERVLATLERRMGGREAGPGPVPDLPAVTIGDVRVVWDRDGGERVAWPVISLAGAPEPDRGWSFQAGLGSLVRLQGRLGPDPGWRQEIAFETEDLAALVAPWLDGPPSPLRLHGSWTGELVGGVPRGWLRLDDTRLGDVAADGQVRLSMDGPAFIGEPVDLTIRVEPDADDAGAVVRLIGGSVRFDGATLSLDELLVEAFSLRTALSGAARLDARDLALAGPWSGRIDPLGLSGQGDVSLVGSWPRLGRPVASATLSVEGRRTEGTLRTTIEAHATGSSLEAMSITLAAPALRWNDEIGPVDLAGTTAALRLEWPTLIAESVTLPGADPPTLRGQVNLGDLRWSLEGRAKGWRPPRWWRGEPIDLQVSGTGDASRIDVSRFAVRAGKTAVEGAARYELSAAAASSGTSGASPLSGTATVTVSGPFGAARGGADRQPGAGTGSLRAVVDVEGALEPVELRFAGDLRAADLPVAEGPPLQLQMPWHGTIDAERTAFQTGEFEILGGVCELQGVARHADRFLHADLSARAVDMSSVGKLLDLPVALQGALTATIGIDVPGLDVRELDLGGEWEVRDLRAAAFAADHGRGRFRTADRVILLEDFVVEHGAGRLSGGASFDLNDRTHVVVDVESADWPLRSGDSAIRAVVDGRASLSLSLTDATAVGEYDLSGRLAYGDESLGHLALQGRVDGRRVELARLEGTLLGGALKGQGVLPLDDWMSARGLVEVDHLAAADLSRLDPALSGAEGVVTGRIEFGPNPDRRALEPLRVTASFTAVNGRFETVDVTRVELSAQAGPERLVLDRSTIDVAGGRVTAWGTTSRHGSDRFVHVFVELADLDLQPLTAIAMPEGDGLAGRLSGHVTMGGYPADPRRSFGAGRLRLRQSDLAAVPPFSLLYDVLRVPFGPAKPEGYGEVELKLEGSVLSVPRLTYFNRGTDVVASVIARDIWLLDGTPIEGLAVGTLQPLRDLDLPMVRDLDRLLAGLQTGAATVRIGGTAGEPRIDVVPLADVARAAQRLLKAAISP